MQKNLKKAATWKKKEIEGLPLQKKTNILLINTKEKDEELCDFEDNESERAKITWE